MMKFICVLLTTAAIVIALMIISKVTGLDYVMLLASTALAHSIAGDFK